MKIGLKKELMIGFDEALARVPEALKEEGFGVLTEVDVQQTLKKKLGEDFRRYRILGACNPSLAFEALSHDLAAGVLMPCNLVVYEGDDRNAVVLAIDPLQTAAAMTTPAMVHFAKGVRDRLLKVLERL